MLTDAGITVFHVVPTLRGALKAVDAGVDGLIVEGVEGGGGPRVVDDGADATGDGGAGDRCGRCDGVSMAAALTGADGVHTRMRVAGTRQLETGGNSGRRDRHGVVEIRAPGHAGAAELTEMEHSDQVHLLMERVGCVPFGGHRIDDGGRHLAGAWHVCQARLRSLGEAAG